MHIIVEVNKMKNKKQIKKKRYERINKICLFTAIASFIVILMLGFISAEVNNTITQQRVTGAATSMIKYLWAFMFFIMISCFFVYVQGSENLFQFVARVIWYSIEMVIGFIIITQAIVFVRTVMGS